MVDFTHLEAQGLDSPSPPCQSAQPGSMHCRPHVRSLSSEKTDQGSSLLFLWRRTAFLKLFWLKNKRCHIRVSTGHYNWKLKVFNLWLAISIMWCYWEGIIHILTYKFQPPMLLSVSPFPIYPHRNKTNVLLTEGQHVKFPRKPFKIF